MGDGSSGVDADVHYDALRIYLVHSSIDPERLAALQDVADHHVLDDGLALVETRLTRSRLYHEVKWAAPPDTPLLVVELLAEPKMRGMSAGSVAWVRDRLRRS